MDDVNFDYLNTDSGFTALQGKLSGMTQDDYDSALRKQYEDYYLIAQAFMTKEGKKLLALLEDRIRTETPFDPQKVARLGIDTANSYSYAMAGQHAMIKQFLFAIDIIDRYKTPEEYIQAKRPTTKTGA